jgi:hypothetical protein
MLIVGTGVMQMWPAGAAGPTIDTNINDYSLFALNHLSIKGGNGSVSQYSGNIGVKNADPNPGDSNQSLTMCNSGHGVHMADGSQVVADTIQSDPTCSYYDLFGNAVTGPPTVRDSQQTWTPPLPMNLPAPAAGACDPNNTSANVGKNGTATIAPGSYGEITWQDGSEVTLQAGTYVFCSLNIGKNAIVHTVPGVYIKVIAPAVNPKSGDGTINIDNGATFGTACDVTVFVNGDTDPNDNDTNFGQGATVWGTFITPNGETALGRDTELHGRFWGISMHDDFNMEINICTPETNTTTTTSAPTTTSSTSTSSTSTSTTSTTSTSTSTTSTSSTTASSTTPTTTASTTSTSTTSSSTSTSTSISPTTVTLPTTTTTAAESTTVVTEGTTATTMESTTTIPGTVTTLGNVTTTTTPHVLPFTGSNGLPPLLGLVSLAFGGTLLLITRRRARRA